WRVRRLDEPPDFDEVSGGAYAAGIELIGEPVAANLLGFTVVVLGHHRIGLRREDKRAGRIGLETHDLQLIVAAAEQDETGESEHTHRVDPPDQRQASIPHWSARGKPDFARGASGGGLAAVPRRSPWYRRAQISSHHQRFSRY